MPKMPVWKADFSPVEHKPRNVPKFGPPHVKAKRQQEEEVHRMVADAKKKIKFKKTGKGRLLADAESREAMDSFLLKLRGMGFSMSDICKITLPLYPGIRDPKKLVAGIQQRISRAGFAQGRGKKEFSSKGNIEGTKWQTMKEKRAEAKELNKFYNKVEKIRSKNPLATVKQIAQKTGYAQTKASELMKVIYGGVGESKKPLFDSRQSPRKKIRKPVFTKEQKFEMTYDTHTGLIVTLVRREFRGFGPEEIEDKLGEVQLRLLDELGLFNPKQGRTIGAFIGERTQFLLEHMKREFAIRNRGKPEYIKAEKRRILGEQRNH